MGLENLHNGHLENPSIQEDIKNVKNNIAILRDDLDKLENEKQDLKHSEYLYKKSNLDLQIQWLEEILNFVENDFHNDAIHIQESTLRDLSILADLDMAPNITYTKKYQDLEAYRNYRQVRAAKLRLDKLSKIKASLLEDKIDPESLFRYVRNRKPETLRDLVEFSMTPILSQVALTGEGIATFDRGLDMIAEKYLDEIFDELIENKNEKKKKKNPKWKESFDESKFMTEGFNMTKQEFSILAYNALQDADEDIINMFKTYAMSVKLQGKIITIDPIQDINLVTKSEEKRNDFEYTVQGGDTLGAIIFARRDDLVITQKQLSGKISKLERLPDLHPGDIIFRVGNIYTIQKLGENPYSFKIWPNNGNVILIS